MKTYRHSRDIAPPIFTSALDGEEWLASRLGCFKWSDNKVRELATVCLPWQHWIKALVWFDDVDISAFHSCVVVVVELWQSLSEWRQLLSACTPGKELRYLFNTRPIGPQSRYGHFGGEKNLLPLRGFEPLTFKPVG